MSKFDGNFVEFSPILFKEFCSSYKQNKIPINTVLLSLSSGMRSKIKTNEPLNICKSVVLYDLRNFICGISSDTPRNARMDSIIGDDSLLCNNDHPSPSNTRWWNEKSEIRETVKYVKSTKNSRPFLLFWAILKAPVPLVPQCQDNQIIWCKTIEKYRVEFCRWKQISHGWSNFAWLCNWT